MSSPDRRRRQAQHSSGVRHGVWTAPRRGTTVLPAHPRCGQHAFARDLVTTRQRATTPTCRGRHHLRDRSHASVLSCPVLSAAQELPPARWRRARSGSIPELARGSTAHGRSCESGGTEPARQAAAHDRMSLHPRQINRAFWWPNVTCRQGGRSSDPEGGRSRPSRADPCHCFRVSVRSSCPVGGGVMCPPAQVDGGRGCRGRPVRRPEWTRPGGRRRWCRP